MIEILAEDVPLLSQTQHGLASLVAFLILFLPLLAIPWAFKLAGGIVGKINELLGGYGSKITEAIKGNPNDPTSFRNQARHRVGENLAATTAGRLSTMREWTRGAPPAGAGPVATAAWKARRRGANAVLGAFPQFFDTDRYRSEQNEKFEKVVMGKVGSAGDNLERAFFAKQWMEADRSYTDSNGKTQVLQRGQYYSTYRDEDGKYKHFSSGDVVASHRLYNRDESKIQKLVKYELGKVGSDVDMYGVDSTGNIIYDPSQLGSVDRSRMPMGSFLSNLPSTLREAGLNHNSAVSASTGAFYEKQGERRELKHTVLQPDWTWQQNPNSFVADFAENVGNYPAASGKTSPIKRLSDLYQKYSAISPATRTPEQQRSMDDFKRIALALDTRMRGMASGAMDEHGNQITGPGGGGGVSGGAARVNDAVQEYIHLVIPNSTGWTPTPPLTQRPL